MSTRPVRLVFGVASILLAAGTAQAQTAPSCSFDPDTATLTVTVNGIAASINRTGPGQIRVGTTVCTGATVTTTDTILVNGGDLIDPVTVSGSFAPGLTAEGDGNSEIEIVHSLGGGEDTFRYNATDNPETLTLTAGGMDIGNDLDEDITTAGIELVRIYSLGGDDIVDGAAYVGGGKLVIYGGDGNDILYAGPQADKLYGQSGNDSMYGGAGNDRLYGAAGNDDYYGEGDNDNFYQDGAVDGNDNFYGGDGTDTVFYNKRIVGVTVTIGNGAADDGEPGGETDYVDEFVENVTSGAGNDVLVGNGSLNVLTGGVGDDELYGGDNLDTLYGGDGNDILVGDAGRDTLYGDRGMDSLDGGIGNDNLYGGTGADTITGGAGLDDIFGEASNDIIFNNDGQADIVDCGTGAADDAEVDPFDTLIGCEV